MAFTGSKKPAHIMHPNNDSDSAVRCELARLGKLKERLMGALITLTILIWAIALFAHTPPPPKSKPYGCLEAVTIDGDVNPEITAPTPSPT
jgi:hypothetical protein